GPRPRRQGRPAARPSRRDQRRGARPRRGRRPPQARRQRRLKSAQGRSPFCGSALGSAALRGGPMRLKALLVIALAALCACSQSHPSGGAPQKTVIRFATDWRAEAEHGGFYEALATGEYAKRGLDVRIIPGGPTVNVPELVASHAVELGVGSNSFIVMN